MLRPQIGVNGTLRALAGLALAFSLAACGAQEETKSTWELLAPTPTVTLDADNELARFAVALAAPEGVDTTVYALDVTSGTLTLGVEDDGAVRLDELYYYFDPVLVNAGGWLIDGLYMVGMRIELGAPVIMENTNWTGVLAAETNGTVAVLFDFAIVVPGWSEMYVMDTVKIDGVYFSAELYEVGNRLEGDFALVKSGPFYETGNLEIFNLTVLGHGVDTGATLP